MILNVEQTLLDYLNEYGFLFENDSVILKEDINTYKKIEKVKIIYKQKRERLDKEKEDAIEKIKDHREGILQKLKDYGIELGKEVTEDIEDDVHNQVRRVARFFLGKKALLSKEELETIRKIKKGSLVVSGVGLASMLIYTSYKTYKKDERKYEKYCEDKKGRQKRVCILNIRIELLKRRSKFLNNAAIKCDYSKNPVECKKKLDQEKIRLEEKIKDYLTDLRSETIGDF